MQRLSIIRWQQTQGKYVGIIQSLEMFKSSTLRPRATVQGSTVLEGELISSGQKDWYCVSFPIEEMEFDEARERGRTLLEMENQRRAAGKPSLTAG